jgi:23S rRNA (uracil747-C5)-methyltransferase
MSVTGLVGSPIIGITTPGRESQDLVDCKLSAPSITSLLKSLGSLITKYSLTPYDIKQRRGELKYLIVTSTLDSSQGILRFVLRSSESVARINKAIPEIQREFPWIKVISCNIQPIPAAILEGPEEIVLTEGKTIKETFTGVPLYFAPQSFMQVTPTIAQELYKTAAAIVADTAPQRVLDLFCGVGGFSLLASKHCESLLGVEISQQAIDCANKSALEMGLKNAEFVAQDVDQFLANNQGVKPDLVITNPPRKGLTRAVIEFLKHSNPHTIIYSSCSPETFIRNVSLLRTSFHLDSITPFDMFPMTEHWEVLGILTRSK